MAETAVGGSRLPPFARNYPPRRGPQGAFFGPTKRHHFPTKRPGKCQLNRQFENMAKQPLLCVLLVPAMLARHGRLDAPGCRAPWPKMTLLLTVCPANVRTSPWRDATSPHTLIPLHTRCQPLHTFTLAPHRHHHHHRVRNHVF